MNTEDLKKIREELVNHAGCEEHLGHRERDIENSKEALRLFDAHVAALTQQEAEEIAVCCGRRECGGECGNEWQGMMTPKPASLPQPVASVPQPIQEIAGQLYQCAGAYDMPDSVLDVLAALMTGSIPENVDLLPMHKPSVPQDVGEISDESLVKIRRSLEQNIGLAKANLTPQHVAMGRESLQIFDKLRTFLSQRDADKKLPQDAREFIYTKGNSAAQFGDSQDVILVSDFEEFLAQRDAGSVRVPVEPKISNSMKSECIGEFSFKIDDACGECLDVGADDDCEVCGGEIEYQRDISVPWDVCKDIFKRMYKAMLTASKEGKV